MTDHTSDNKSLFLYTGLIFIAAIVMIIISFFAQTHLEQESAIQMGAENVRLSNKAAQVSEENLQLVELNKTLRITNKDLLDKNSALTLERDALLKDKAAYEVFTDVYEKLLKKDKEGALTLLQGVYTEDLSPELKELYDKLVKKLQ